MTERGKQLHAAADEQIAQLISVVSTLNEAALRRPCSGREKLGDGTVAASLRHTADNYQRMAVFVQRSDRMTAAHAPSQPGSHRVPRFLRSLHHRPTGHAQHDPATGPHKDQYTASTVNLDAVVKQLTASRDTLGQIAELTASQLDAIPPKDSFRFCDGQRTLDQVLASLLKHQRHQVDALKAANPEHPGHGSTSPSTSGSASAAGLYQPATRLGTDDGQGHH